MIATMLFSAFSESTTGRVSSMRLMSAVVVVFIMVGWLRVSWTTGQMAPLLLDGPGGVLLGALGIKAWQRGREGLKPSPNTISDTSIIGK